MKLKIKKKLSNAYNIKFIDKMETFEDFLDRGIGFRCHFNLGKITKVEPKRSPKQKTPFSIEELIHRLCFSQVKSKFALQVLFACKNIPSGKTVTYSELAKIIGKPKSYRAVGSALAKNPFFYLIPCHRVVGKKNMLNYKWGSSLKKSILTLEGSLP